MSVEVFFAGERHKLTADRMQIIDLLLSTFEAAVMQAEQIEQLSSQSRDAQEEARRLQENFRTLLENLEDGVVVVGPDGLVRYANGAAFVLLGNAVQIGAPFPLPPGGGKTGDLPWCTPTEPPSSGTFGWSTPPGTGSWCGW